ncbi:hypothetical protein FHS42_004923 [Streptomyces zagrosensis]|uniref:Uncharacterized protein n=1 Tax=Streptomyces zagrosensis TaxID=1042984 RepID=A0A7W9QDB8_9ACTN|nr:hypothetical protein [Streptomyces zagrosensis]MBB5937839.1 hypothetical protein [Streptomyces zagrosensis]
MRGGPLDALAQRHGLTSMTVTETHHLTAPGRPRPKRFLRLALSAQIRMAAGRYVEDVYAGG